MASGDRVRVQQGAVPGGGGSGTPSAGTAIAVNDGPNGACFGVRVQLRAARARISGVRNGSLQVHLDKPPVDGAANAALVRLLSRCLRVAPSAVTIVHGQKGRNKTVRIAGLSAASLSLMVSALVEPRRVGAEGD